MKKLAFLPLAALALAAACADMPTTAAPDQAAFNRKGVSEPGTTALIAFVLTVQGIPAGVNQHPEGKGGCRDANGNSGNTTAHTV
jgi:hypothetical protein